MAATTALLLGSLAAGAVGTAITAAAQQNQASSQESMANYNYKLQQQNIAVQNKMAAYQYQVSQANAKQLDEQASAQESQGLEQAARTRAEKDRAISSQRGEYAASGVTEDGSPLAVMADTASNYELQAHDQLWKANSDATNSRWQAQTTRTNAIAQLDLSKIQSQLDSQRNLLTLQSGYDTAAGTRASSYATLFSGLSQAGSMLTYYKK